MKENIYTHMIDIRIVLANEKEFRQCLRILRKPWKTERRMMKERENSDPLVPNNRVRSVLEGVPERFQSSLA